MIDDHRSTPEVQGIGRLPMSARLVPYDDLATARLEGPSPWLRGLDGRWRFRLLPRPDAVDRDALTGPVDDWDEIDVPGTWVLQGHGAPIYLNVRMPFALQPPEVPQDNPTGVYRRRFRLPASWRSRRTVLRVGSADAMAWVWVNGTFVGMGKDSRLPSSFDLTDHLRRGDNEIALVVPRWSDASWIEDQDQWWMPGLHRSVELVSVPNTAIVDAALVPGLDRDDSTGLLQVEVTVDVGPADAASLTVEVVVEGDRHRVIGGMGRTPVPAWDESAATWLTYVWPGHRVLGSIRVPGIEPWSHEHPRRYRAVVVLRNGDTVVDVRTMAVGFRRVEIAGNALLVNGRPVVINGVNRHEAHPDRGRTLEPADVRRDLELMKQHHVNAVRASHYPMGEAFYELCDELGLYVVDEANIEAHGRWARLAWDPAYLAAFVERGARMVLRDRSHPCVIAWSLGNESGYGPAHDAMAAWIRRSDPSRPIQYEGPWAFFPDIDAEAPVSDVVCPMYAEPERILEWSRATSDTRRPLILCEYGHAMGQAGGLADYWALFGRERGLQGGFVWEWCDHALRRHEPDGTSWLAYGGDFGEPIHDGAFICDGLVSADREPHPLLAELAALAAPVSVDWAVPGRLRVSNRRWFTTLADLEARWSLEVDGDERDRGVLDLPEVPPQGDVVVAAPVRRATGNEAHLTITFRPRRRPPWAPRGWVTATIQLEVPTTPVNRRPGGADTSVDEGGLVVGDLLLGWPEACLWRAPTDNDDPPGDWRPFVPAARQWRAYGLDHLRVVDRSLRRRGGSHVRTTRFAAADDAEVVHRQTVTPGPEGLRIDEQVLIDARIADVPRVGVSFVAPGELARLEWYGLGPGDSYPDRRAAARVGRWRVDVARQVLPFVVPQEHGLHLATRWFTLSSARRGLFVHAAEPFAFSALPFSVDDLTTARHAHQLAARRETYVHLDVAHRGLGTAACGPDVHPRHRLGPGTYRWTWELTDHPGAGRVTPSPR